MKTNFLIPLIAGVGLLCACKGKGTAGSVDSASAPLNKAANVVSKSDTIQNGQKLVKTADMRFKVKNVEQTSERIAALTASFNGTVVHHVISSTTGNSTDIIKSNDSLMRVTVLNTTAEMTVRIPPANMESFMGQVARLGIYINNSRMDITDKSLDYLSTRLKLKNQNELVAQQKREDSNKKDPDNLLAFKNSMVDQQIGNRKIDDSVKTSTITLSFYESNIVSREIIANDDLSAYRLPFSKRVSIAMENGWGILVDIMVGIANLWFLLPFAIGGWMVVRYYKRKKPDLAKAG